MMVIVVVIIHDSLYIKSSLLSYDMNRVYIVSSFHVSHHDDTDTISIKMLFLMIGLIIGSLRTATTTIGYFLYLHSYLFYRSTVRIFRFRHRRIGKRTNMEHTILLDRHYIAFVGGWGLIVWMIVVTNRYVGRILFSYHCYSCCFRSLSNLRHGKHTGLKIVP
jgi:hypothetical protein